ncbi:SOK1 Protein SOK1 [Candida maltosa Xu316]
MATNPQQQQQPPPNQPSTAGTTASATSSTSSVDPTVSVAQQSSTNPTSTNATQQSSHQEFRQVCFNQSPASIISNNTTTTTTSIKRNSPTSSDSSKRIRLDNTNTTTTTTLNKPPKFIRKYRSRSLPIINFNTTSSAFYPHLRKKNHHHHHHHNHQNFFNPNISSSSINNNSTTNNLPSSSSSSSAFSSNTTQSNNITTIPPLPPINLQSLKEIDLHEILKNPQLRHDILFDPQLQFRPNLDGERGKRKKSIIDKYWMEIQKECQQFFNTNGNIKEIKINRLPILFTTLRDILLSLLPTKDRQQVGEIMDIELLVQQLKHGSFDFVEMSNWLGDVFKSHCAPMRDQWVVEMMEKFVDAYNLNNVNYLVSGLRMIFQILEAMKLDVANHQIRILRPVLIETAVDFEKDYFQTLINHNKININDSLNWFYKNLVKNFTANGEINDLNLKPIIISSIIDLLSCRQMATEFPSTLAFDHTRLVLLRADVRQLVCVQLCVVLYKQLVINSHRPNAKKLLSPANILKVQQEILAIVTDDNGNIKWTKNISAISLQLVKNLYDENEESKKMIDFSHNWLIKHIQPNSEVYGLMEIKIFKELFSEISVLIESEDLISSTAASTTTTNNNITTTDNKNTISNNNTATSTTTELKNIANRIATLVKFHWNVFGNYYIDYIKSQHNKLLQQEQDVSIVPALIDGEDADGEDKLNPKNNKNSKTGKNEFDENHRGDNNSSIDNTTSAPLSMLS